MNKLILNLIWTGVLIVTLNSVAQTNTPNVFYGGESSILFNIIWILVYGLITIKVYHSSIFSHPLDSKKVLPLIEKMEGLFSKLPLEGIIGSYQGTFKRPFIEKSTITKEREDSLFESVENIFHLLERSIGTAPQRMYRTFIEFLHISKIAVIVNLILTMIPSVKVFSIHNVNDLCDNLINYYSGIIPILGVSILVLLVLNFAKKEVIIYYYYIVLLLWGEPRYRNQIKKYLYNYN